MKENLTTRSPSGCARVLLRCLPVDQLDAMAYAESRREDDKENSRTRLLGRGSGGHRDGVRGLR